jgi:hypothetical protein
MSRSWSTHREANASHAHPLASRRFVCQVNICCTTQEVLSIDKCFLRESRCQSQEQQDAWFEHDFPPGGAWVVVSGSDGYGPHTDNPHIFNVNKVHDVIML